MKHLFFLLLFLLLSCGQDGLSTEKNCFDQSSSNIGLSGKMLFYLVHGESRHDQCLVSISDTAVTLCTGEKFVIGGRLNNKIQLCSDAGITQGEAIIYSTGELTISVIDKDGDTVVFETVSDMCLHSEK